MVFSQVGKTIKQSIFLLYDSLCPADRGREKGNQSGRNRTERNGTTQNNKEKHKGTLDKYFTSMDIYKISSIYIYKVHF